MPRQKLYDRDRLLDRAIELFRKQGFNGTSTAELVEELGVNRKSMYAEFGSKQDLFEAVLERYSKKHLTRVLAPIEAADAGAEAIKAAFEGYAAAGEGQWRGKGCLMCNTAVERSALDPGSAKYVSAFTERVRNGFRQALQNARKRGEIKQDVQIDALASYFTMSLIGVSALVRAEVPSEQIREACNVTTSVLDT